LSAQRGGEDESRGRESEFHWFCLLVSILWHEFSQNRNMPDATLVSEEEYLVERNNIDAMTE